MFQVDSYASSYTGSRTDHLQASGHRPENNNTIHVRHLVLRFIYQAYPHSASTVTHITANRYCQTSSWRRRCQLKISALALLQSGTQCHITLHLVNVYTQGVVSKLKLLTLPNAYSGRTVSLGDNAGVSRCTVNR